MRYILILLTGLLITLSAFAAEDIIIADFEGTDYGDWKVRGKAFGDGPVQGTLPGQMKVDGFEGKGLVNSFSGGDASRGTLTSPNFIIERKYINFLMGGGGWEDKTAMQLRVDGKVIHKAAGPNKNPGGSETLRWRSWDVSEFMGKDAQLRIVDDRTEGWGHINVDHIVQSDEKVTSEKQRDITVSKKLLNLPVRNNEPKTWMRLKQGDEILREFDIELAQDIDDVDFWVTLDLSEFQGETLQLWADNISKSSKGFELITQADTLIGGENLYAETYRPQVHFSPMRGWNNDPNGMMYYKGEYHLFFQHNPYGWNWGNMTWGHAVSKDLVHWEELGDALHPDEHGTMFSGSGVVDWNNTTGFQTGDEPPLICIFTYAGDNNLSSKDVEYTQGIAYSNDRGRTWTKYKGNPVQGHLAGRNRDPKVIWHTPTNQWVIVMYLDKKQLVFFTSPDLKTWTQTSILDSFYECPEMFELPVDGDADKMKWVLYGASGEYHVGEFDGKTFVPHGDVLPFNYGNCFYASQTFSDIPAADGRRIQMGWGRTGHPDMPFNQQMDFPVALRLETTPDGIRMLAEPVNELDLLHDGQPIVIEEEALIEGNTLTLEASELLDIRATIDIGTARTLDFNIRGLNITYDTDKHELKCKDNSAKVSPVDDELTLQIIVDRLSAEIFVNQGAIYMPMAHVFDPAKITLETKATGGDATIKSLFVHALKSAW